MTAQRPLWFHFLWFWTWLGVAAAGGVAAGPPPPDAPPAVTATQARVVRVCVYNFAPLLFLHTDHADGFFIDLTKYVAEQEGWTLEYVFAPFAECLRQLEDGRVDVLPSIAITPARLEKLAFTADHFFLDWAIIYQPTGSNVSSILDLQAKTVAVLRGSVFTSELQAELDQFGVQAQLMEMDDYAEVLQAIAERRVDAGVCTNVLGLELESHYAVERTQVIFAPVKIRFAFNKDAPPELVQAFDTHLGQLKADPNSLYYTQHAKWLEARPDAPGLPEWVVWGAAGLVAAVLGLLGLTAALRALVHRRTRQLQEANHALAHSEAAYRAMFEKNQAVKLLIDPDTGALADANTAAVTFYGYARETLLTMRITDLNTLPPAEVRAEMARAVTEKRTHFNFKHRLANGDIRDVEVYSGPVEVNGRVYLHSIVHDITERQQAEAALRASEAKFARAFLASPDAVSISLLDTGEFLEVNESFERIFGYTRAEAVGRTSLALNLLSPADRARMVASLEASGRVRQLTLPIRHKNGDTLSCQMDAERMEWDGRICLVAIVRDLTQQEQAEAVDAARARLIDYSLSHSLDELLQRTLDEVEALTHSRVGFYHFVEPDQAMLALQMWSSRTLQEYCRAEGHGLHYPIAQAGVWVDCVYARQPVIHNDYAALPHRKGLPVGHAELTRELVVPILRDERIVAILGVGNKPMPYVTRDVEVAHRLADLAWDIAERKRAEQALRDSEERYRLLVENSPYCIHEVDLNGQLISMNQAGLRMMGVTDFSAIQHLPYLETVADEDRARVGDLLARALRGQAAEFEFQARSGAIFQSSFVPITGADGSVIRLFGLTRDITERRQAEEKLRESEAALRKAQSVAHVGSWVWLPLENRLEWSDEMFHIFGLDKETFTDDLGAVMANAIHPEDRAAVEASNALVVERQTPLPLEYRVVWPDGSVHWVWGEAGEMLLDENGQTQRLTGIVQDITERKRAEKIQQEYVTVLETLDAVDQLILSSKDPEAMLNGVLDQLLAIFGCDRAFLLLPCNPLAPAWKIVLEKTHPNYPGLLSRGIEIPMNEAAAYLMQRALETTVAVTFELEALKRIMGEAPESRFGMQSQMVMALHPRIGEPWMFGLHQCAHDRQWTEREKSLFQEIGGRISDSLSSFLLLQELRTSEARYRALVEQASDGIFVADDEGRYLDVNPSGCAMLGYTLEEMLTLSLKDLIPAEDLALIPLRVDEMRAGHTVLSERRLRAKDGRLVPVEISGRRLANGYLQGIVRDISQRKHAEAQLRQLSQAVEQSPATIVITDTHGAIQYANPAFTRTTGYTVAEALGQNPRLLKSGHTPSEEYSQLWQTVLAGGEWRGEFHNRKKDGTLYWESAIISPIKNEAGRVTHFVAVKEDITERKRAEAELAATNARLEQALWDANQLAIQAQAANRLKSEILANTSHELRTPLTGVIGSLSVVLEGLCDTRAEERSFLETAYHSSRNLLDLINNLLDMAKIEAGKMEVETRAVEVAGVLAEVEALSRAQALEKHLLLRVAPAPQPPVWAQADPEKVRQIVLNLVNNAIKFTEHGEVALSLFADARAHEAYILVQDTGIGVPLDQQAKLFQPFVQADGTSTRRFGGTGLGLSLSRQLAELMGGRLDLHSAGLGQGCTLTLTLPLARP